MNLIQARDDVSFLKEIVRIQVAEKANVTTEQLVRAMQETISPPKSGVLQF